MSRGEQPAVASDAAWARLAEQLDSLLDLDPDARGAALAALPADDAEALRGWMADIQRSEGLLEAAPAPAMPERLGPWRLLGAVGRGGMGEVWRGERADGAFQRSVAIKFLRRDRPEAARSIARERALLARLRHPAIAQLLDGGVAADGRPFLVTEWVEGQPLDRWLAGTRPALRARVALLLTLARAVAYAHGQRVLHRDLKPANVLVEADGTPRLLDFGIGRLVEDAGGATEDAALTPAFAAPEQLRGEAADARTDVHALGALLWFVLCGAPPHGSDGRSLAELVERVCQRDAEAPSRHACVAGVDADLDAIALKALAREAAQRYASADAFALDLERWLDGREVQARLPGRGERLWRALRRHPLESALALALLLSLGGGVLAAREQARRAEAERALALAARDAAVAEADRGERLVDTFASLFARVGAGQSLSANAWLDRARDAAVELLDDDAGAGLALLVRLAAVEQDRGEHARALALLDAVAAQQAALPDELAARAGCRRATALAMLGREDAALAAFAQATALAAGLQGSDRLVHVECLVGRANLGLLRGSASAEELAAAERALAELDALQGHGDLRWRRAGILYTLAALHDLSGHDAEAATRYGEVMALDRELGNTETTDHATLIASRAGALQRAGEWAQADADYTRAIALHARLAPEHPNLASHLANLAGLKALRGDGAAAQSLAAEALALPSPHPLARANALHAQGHGALLQGDFAIAAQQLTAAEAAYAAAGQASRGLRSRVLQLRVLRLRGALPEAQALQAQLHAAQGDSVDAELLAEDVALALARGDLAEARTHADALLAARAALSPAHPQRLLAELSSLRVREASGEHVTDALAATRRALAPALLPSHPALRPSP